MNILFFLRPKATISYLYDTDSLRQALEKIKKSGYTNLPVISKSGEFKYALSEGDILFKILEDDVFSIHHSESIKIEDIKKRRNFKTINIYRYLLNKAMSLCLMMKISSLELLLAMILLNIFLIIKKM